MVPACLTEKGKLFHINIGAAISNVQSRNAEIYHDFEQYLNDRRMAFLFCLSLKFLYCN